jgi:hypothetical protein
MITPSHVAQRLIVLTGLLLAGVPTFAYFSGLVLIPTADVLPAGAFVAVAQVDGVLPTHQADTYLFDTEFGVTDRLEVGADYDFSSGVTTRGYLDAKYLLPLAEEDGAPQFAVGIYNIARHTTASPYVVATRDFSLLRGHAGAVLLDGDPQAFFGADCTIGDCWSLMADYTTGPANYASVGVYTDLTDRFNLLVGAEFPNAGGETLFTVQFGLGGAYRHCPAKE